MIIHRPHIVYEAFRQFIVTGLLCILTAPGCMGADFLRLTTAIEPHGGDLQPGKLVISGEAALKDSSITSSLYYKTALIQSDSQKEFGIGNHYQLGGWDTVGYRFSYAWSGISTTFAKWQLQWESQSKLYDIHFQNTLQIWPDHTVPGLEAAVMLHLTSQFNLYLGGTGRLDRQQGNTTVYELSSHYKITHDWEFRQGIEGGKLDTLREFPTDPSGEFSAMYWLLTYHWANDLQLTLKYHSTQLSDKSLDTYWQFNLVKYMLSPTREIELSH